MNLRGQPVQVKEKIPLPIMINRFLEFQKTDTQSFREKWKQWKKLYPTTVLKTEDIQLNSEIIKAASDFQKLSDKLLCLPFKSQWKRKRYVKFGGVFTLNFLATEYLLRIFADISLNQGVIQMICYPGKENIATVVAGCLAFLFQKN